MTIRKAKRKPEQVEFVEWTGYNGETVRELIGDKLLSVNTGGNCHVDFGRCETPVHVGLYIIKKQSLAENAKEGDFELEMMHPDRFRKLYELTDVD